MSAGKGLGVRSEQAGNVPRSEPTRGFASGEASEAAGPTRRRVEVALGERSYPIEIGVGTLGELGAAVKRAVAPTRALLITTPPVGRRYAAPRAPLAARGGPRRQALRRARTASAARASRRLDGSTTRCSRRAPTAAA